MLVALCAVVFGLGFITAIAISSTAKFKMPLGPIATRAPLSKASDFSPDFVKDDASRTERVVHIDDRDLMTRAQCEALSHNDWRRQAYHNIQSILLAEGSAAQSFPCIYATAGFKQNQHRFLFMHSADSEQPSNIRLIANALRAYLPLSHSLGPNTSLLLVHPPSSDCSSVEEYRQKFWAVLRSLRLCDLEPWPENIPTKTNASEWTFCFDGVPWFLAALTPAHKQRQSRRADNFTIAVQPKWVFNKLFKTPETRERAVQAVRKLMPAFDQIGISPDLAAYGSEGSTEAHQYYLLDENETAHCPFGDLDLR